MGVHARQGFNIQPLPATGHLGRVDITNLISTLLKSNVNVNVDVNDFVIDTWLLSLRNRKLACISLVCTSVDLGSAVFSHPDGSYR